MIKTLQYILFLGLILGSNFSFGQKEFSDMLFYGSDKHEITDHHSQLLDSLAERYTYFNDYSIEVIGHADSKGSIEYNKKIAERRANLVYKYLLNAGLPKSKIKISAVGSDMPLDAKFLSNPQASSRRVELKCSATLFSSVDDFLNQLGPKKQVRTIDNSIDQTITLLDGAEIFIPANSLVYADGSGLVDGMVEVEVKESYDVMDFVSEDLMTKTQDGLLQTGGMIYINATASGQQLGIKQGEQLDVTFPEKKIDNGMLLYEAREVQDRYIWDLVDGDIKLESHQSEVDYDLERIMNLDIVTPTMPSIAFEKLPKIPVVPNKPIKPEMPVKPSKDEIAKGFESQKEVEAEYSKQLARYTKDSMRYQARLARYEGLMLNYDTVRPKAESDLKNWKEEVSRRVAKIKEYENQMKDYYCDVKLNNGIQYVQEHYGTLPANDVYKGFKEIVYGEIDLEGLIDPYQVAFGNFKNKVIRDQKIKRDYLNYNRYGRKSKFHTSIKPLLSAIEEDYMNAKLSVDMAGPGDLDKYMFSVGSFGYHNVDKPLDLLPEEQMELVINDREADTKYYVVLKDAASMVSPIHVADSHVLDGLPKGQEMKIIGVKLVDSVPHVAVANINSGQDARYDLDMSFEATNLANMRAELESLNAYAGI